MQARLTKKPGAVVSLQLAFADERLAEARKMGDIDDSPDFHELFADYGQALQEAIETIDASSEEERLYLINS